MYNLIHYPLLTLSIALFMSFTRIGSNFFHVLKIQPITLALIGLMRAHR